MAIDITKRFQKAEKRITDLYNRLGTGGGASLIPVSATESGIVNNISLQELGGVDKLIHGIRAGRGNSTGPRNTVFGVNSQGNAIAPTNNSSFGFESLRDITTGDGNSAFGRETLLVNIAGSFNSAFGGGVLKANIGSSNTAMGYTSLTANTTGADNVGFGSGSLNFNLVGNGNTAVGRVALGNSLGDHNIGIGYLGGSGITTGSRNIIIATQPSFTTAGITTGSNNLIVSQNDGNTTGITTGSGNTIIGKVTGLTAALANTVILSDGVGTQRFVSDSTNLSTLPAQTLALINADVSGKAIITKEFTNQGININSTNVPIGGSISITTPAQVTTTVPLALAYSNSTITRTTVTGWTFAVTAGKRYKIEIIGTYQTAVVTTGGSIGFILSSGVGTIHGIMNGEIVQTTGATGLRTTIRDINATNTTVGSFMTTTGVGVINSPHYIGGILNFSCTTSGVFEVQFASEVAASAAQLNAGSLLLVTEY